MKVINIDKNKLFWLALLSILMCLSLSCCGKNNKIIAPVSVDLSTFEDGNIDNETLMELVSFLSTNEVKKYLCTEFDDISKAVTQKNDYHIGDVSATGRDSKYIITYVVMERPEVWEAYVIKYEKNYYLVASKKVSDAKYYFMQQFELKQYKELPDIDGQMYAYEVIDSFEGLKNLIEEENLDLEANQFPNEWFDENQLLILFVSSSKPGAMPWFIDAKQLNTTCEVDYYWEEQVKGKREKSTWIRLLSTSKNVLIQDVKLIQN